MARMNHCRVLSKRSAEIRRLIAMVWHCFLEGDRERSETLLEHIRVGFEKHKDLMEESSIVGLCRTPRFLYDFGASTFTSSRTSRKKTSCF